MHLGSFDRTPLTAFFTWLTSPGLYLKVTSSERTSLITPPNASEDPSATIFFFLMKSQSKGLANQEDAQSTNPEKSLL